MGGYGLPQLSLSRFGTDETGFTGSIDRDGHVVCGLSYFPSTRSREILIAATFELFKDKGGDFRFHLKAASGEIIASG
jgi:hypothetical protein